MAVVTLADRKAQDIGRLREAGRAAMAELRDYARARGVRFTVFGSFARGDLVPTSDFDLLVEGSDALQRNARADAELICERHGLSPDVYLAPEASLGLMRRIHRDGVSLA